MTPIFCMFFGHLHLLQEPLPNEVNFTTLRATGLAWLRHRAPYRIHRSHQVHRKRLAIHRGQFIVSDSFSPLCQENRCTSKRGRFARFGTAASETKEDGQVKPFSGKRLQNTWDLMSPSSFLESYHDIMTSWQDHTRSYMQTRHMFGPVCAASFSQWQHIHLDQTYIFQDVTRLLHETGRSFRWKKVSCPSFPPGAWGAGKPGNSWRYLWVHDSLLLMPRSRKVDVPKGPTLKLYELHEIP